MADEISVPIDLKKSLERREWKGYGICGLLIGRVWRGRLYVLNVWTSPSNSKNILITDLKNCCNHLNAGTDIVGVVVTVKSAELHEAENQLVSLPLEIQTAVASPRFVVCVVQLKTERHAASFHYLSAEDGKLKKLTETTNMKGFCSEQVIFRLQAQIPLQMQISSKKPGANERWEEKIKKAFGNTDIVVSSGGYLYGFRDTNLFMSNSGVIGGKEKISTVQQLHSFILDQEGADISRKKEALASLPPILVNLYQQVSGNTDRFAQPTCAPAVHQRTGDFRSLQLTLPLDVIVEVDVREKLSSLTEFFTKAIRAQLQAMRQCLEQHHCKESEFYIPEPYHFSIPHRHTCVTVVYPRGIPDTELEKRRKYLHDKMCLGVEQPVFRRANVRLFPGQTAAGGYLINPHLSLPPSGVQGGTAHLVQGNYTYHHYMQDRFDDDKWGCAYRSLQTLVSWFRFQGYTDRAVPSHKEIQQALVAVGDKEANFVGSKKWIGSFEVSFCLDHLLGVTSKFLSVSTGAELATKGRELVQHFDTEGTPIMIGGGVLAHTILGVHYDEMSGEIKYLILDPHCTGGEDLHTILKEGWCGWKGSNFWNPTAHYNLCMPMRPKCF